MDLDRFARDLPGLFDEFPASRRPRDPRFAEVIGAVPGLACENNLALLNLAVGCLEPGESYVEVGTFRGTSLIGAALGRKADLVAIDRFRKTRAAPAELRANLARFGVDGVTLLEGDAFELLREGALSDRRVGVYYYDADHSYEAQLQSLQLVEPHLAERALLVVDNTDWRSVAAATRDYLASQPRARLVFEIPGRDKGFPGWWEGVHVLAWEGVQDVATTASASNAGEGR